VSWSVEATVDRVGGEPRLVEVVVRGRDGLDPVFLQRFFRWSTPLDVVRRTLPELIAAGVDPFRHDYATDGYPDAADLRRRFQSARSDEFLEQIAREYLAVGRGYARAIAANRGVSARTVVSWVEKARRRGILSGVRQGQFGGRIVPREQRHPRG
jgi:hypothetical protein